MWRRDALRHWDVNNAYRPKPRKPLGTPGAGGASCYDSGPLSAPAVPRAAGATCSASPRRRPTARGSSQDPAHNCARSTPGRSAGLAGCMYGSSMGAHGRGAGRGSTLLSSGGGGRSTACESDDGLLIVSSGPAVVNATSPALLQDGGGDGVRVLRLNAPVALPSTARMPVRFVVSYVVVNSGLVNLVLEGVEGGGGRVRAPLSLPLPSILWDPQLQRHKPSAESSARQTPPPLPLPRQQSRHGKQQQQPQLQPQVPSAAAEYSRTHRPPQQRPAVAPLAPSLPPARWGITAATTEKASKAAARTALIKLDYRASAPPPPAWRPPFGTGSGGSGTAPTGITNASGSSSSSSGNGSRTSGNSAGGLTAGLVRRLSRPGAAPASRLLACFDPTTLVRRTGTVHVSGRQQQQPQRKAQGQARQPGKEQKPPPAERPHSRHLSPWLRLLREASPSLLPARRGVGAAGAVVTGRPSGAHGLMPPAAFRPTLAVSRAAAGPAVGARTGAAAAATVRNMEERWSPTEEVEAGAGTDRARGGGPIPSRLLQFLRAANPLAHRSQQRHPAGQGTTVSTRTASAMGIPDHGTNPAADAASAVAAQAETAMHLSQLQAAKIAGRSATSSSLPVFPPTVAAAAAPPLSLKQQLGSATSLDALARLLLPRMRNGAAAAAGSSLEPLRSHELALACRSVVGLVLQQADAAVGRRRGRQGSVLQMAWRGSPAASVKGLPSALDLLQRSGGRPGGPSTEGEGTSERADRRQVGPSSDSSNFTGQGVQGREQDTEQVVALGRRLVGRLARHTAAVVAAAAVERASGAAEGAEAPALLLDEVEALLAAVWAYSHLADQHDTLEPGLGLELGSKGKEGLGSATSAALAAATLSRRPFSQQRQLSGEVAAAAAALSLQDGDEAMRWQGAVTAAGPTEAEAVAAAAQAAPFGVVMEELWRLLLRGLAQPGYVPRCWKLWALWAAVRSAPAALPAVLAALAAAPTPSGLGLNERGEQGAHERAHHIRWRAADAAVRSALRNGTSVQTGSGGLIHLAPWQLLSVLWGCGRYVDWCLSQQHHAEERAHEEEEGEASEPRGPVHWGAGPHAAATRAAVGHAAAEALRLLAMHLRKRHLLDGEEQPSDMLCGSGATLPRTGGPAADLPAALRSPSSRSPYSPLPPQPPRVLPSLAHFDLRDALHSAATALPLCAEWAEAQGGSTAEHEVHALVLVEALAAHPDVWLQDVTAMLHLVSSWRPPPDYTHLRSEKHTHSAATQQQHRQQQGQEQQQELASKLAARRAALLRLEAAVLRRLGGLSEEQAQALLSRLGLRDLGIAPSRGWYRRQLRMAPLDPARRKAAAGAGGPTAVGSSAAVRKFAVRGRRDRIAASLGRRHQPFAAAVRRKLQHPLPFRLRLLYGLREEADGELGPQAQSVQVLPFPPLAIDSARTGVPGTDARGLSSLELQLQHQQRLYGNPAVRRYGTADLLELLAALGATAHADPTHPPRPVTVRCVLNALALRWLRSGATSRDVSALIATLRLLHWRPRTVVAVFTTAWRPFVVLTPAAVSDAAVAGMAQVLGRLVSHDRPSAGAEPEVAAGRSAGERRLPSLRLLPWPKLRRFWANLLALATKRLEAGGLALTHSSPNRPAQGSRPQGRDHAGGGLAGQVSSCALPAAHPQPIWPSAIASPPSVTSLSALSLVRLVWSCARQGARAPRFMAMACGRLLPLLPRLPPGVVGDLAWGLGHPRYADPRVVEGLLVLLRRWLACREGCNWTAACHVAWALLRMGRLDVASPELSELLLGQLGPRLQWEEQQQRVKKQQQGYNSWAQRQRASPSSLSTSPIAVVSPRVLAALLWEIHQQRPAGISGGRVAPLAGVTGSVGSPQALQQAALSFGAATFLARHVTDLPPAALLQILQVVASGGGPALVRYRPFVAAFSRAVERRPRWLLRSLEQVRLVLECYRRLGWWPAGQVEELAVRAQDLAVEQRKWR